jgi:ureidoglycolate lyase
VIEKAESAVQRPTLGLVPLTSAAFAPFGAVIEAPAHFGERSFYTRWLGSSLPGAEPMLHVNRVRPRTLPCAVTVLERHPFAAQLFLPLDVAEYLIIVAPGGNEGPDVSRTVCFTAPGTVGIVYAPGVWHAGMTVLARPGSFAVLMWRNGTADDQEFFPLASPLLLEA